MNNKIVPCVIGGLLAGAIVLITTYKIKVRKNEVEEWEE